MCNLCNHEAVFTFAVDVGEVMLKSGAETYRVEDTIMRILSSHHFEKIDAFVTPTGIMTTLADPQFPVCSIIRRVKNRSTRLDKIEAVNQLSRDYVVGSLSLDDAIAALASIERMPAYSSSTLILATGTASAFFSLMFGGALLDFIISFIVGIIVAKLLKILRCKNIVNYFIFFLVSLFVGLVVISTSLILDTAIHVESIIIGSIMPLVPGVALTNAVRDTIGDELLSGISRGVEALFIAISIAAGIGIAMSFGIHLGGLL